MIRFTRYYFKSGFIMRKFTMVLAVSSLMACSSVARSESLVYDSFESGDMSTTSSAGFRWARNSNVSIVTSTREVFKNSIVDEPAPISSLWEAKTGDNALLIRYGAGQSWKEQRFQLKKPQPNIWMSFWLRVPLNYSHPEVEGARDNQKLFRLWMDGYGVKGEGTTVGMSFRGDKNGGSYFFAKINRGDFSVTSSDLGKAQFISIPDDRGRWMHLVVHVKSESEADANDGLMEVWRKWEDESDYTKTHDFDGQPIKLSSTKKGFSAGYIMGWANAAYPVETEFLIDDFELSTSALFLKGNAPNKISKIIVE